MQNKRCITKICPRTYNAGWGWFAFELLQKYGLDLQSNSVTKANSPEWIDNAYDKHARASMNALRPFPAINDEITAKHALRLFFFSTNISPRKFPALVGCSFWRAYWNSRKQCFNESCRVTHEGYRWVPVPHSRDPPCACSEDRS